MIDSADEPEFDTFGIRQYNDELLTVFVNPADGFVQLKSYMENNDDVIIEKINFYAQDIDKVISLLQHIKGEMNDE
jgi:hypothetical protein